MGAFHGFRGNMGTAFSPGFRGSLLYTFFKDKSIGGSSQVPFWRKYPVFQQLNCGNFLGNFLGNFGEVPTPSGKSTLEYDRTIAYVIRKHPRAAGRFWP